MPELPEVESTMRGIRDRILGRRVAKVVVRQPRLRFPVPPDLESDLPGRAVLSVTRRAKYLLISTDAGTLVLHLGMSGSLRVLDRQEKAGVHDHLDLEFEGGILVRLRDPRRFGFALWTRGDPGSLPMLAGLGPEPLGAEFSGDGLYRRARGRKLSVKNFLMDGHVVAGVGNIYAAESLHRAGIYPHRAAGRISRRRFDRLAEVTRTVLQEAIDRGGTTLRDYSGSDGEPGEFAERLLVYGRAGEPCYECGIAIRVTRRGQRASYHCPGCQR